MADLNVKKWQKVCLGLIACLMSAVMVFGLAGTAQAQQSRFTPYFRNSDVWVGDVHMDVLARDDVSKMVATSRSRGSYCKASQDDNRVIDHSAAVGKKCGATAMSSWAIKSAGDYAYYSTL